MEKEVIETDWDEIMTKFSSYDGVIAEFCRANNITPSQLFYRRKKLKKCKVDFHSISLKDSTHFQEATCDSKSHKPQEVRLEIGKATFFIPSNEPDILANLLKELVKSC